MPTQSGDRIIVTTLDELQSLGPKELYSEGQIVEVADDKRGVLFRYESSMHEFDDHGGVALRAENRHVPGGFRRYFEEPIRPEWWGAKGDGQTNDTDAFAAMSRHAERIGGTDIELTAGSTYIVGKQEFAREFGRGYSYDDLPIIRIHDCTNPFTIYGNGATLKLADGLKIGAYHPETGRPYEPADQRVRDNDYKANAGRMIHVSRNRSVTVRDVELDGNAAGLVPGGSYGSETGYQVRASGIVAYENEELTVQNVYSHNHGKDGVMIGHKYLTEGEPEYPIRLLDSRFEYNARQGLSWVGGNSLTATRCSFSHTGRSAFVSPPAAGVDVEAEDSICRNGRFEECEFLNNVGEGIIADTGDVEDVTCTDCTFWSGGGDRGSFAVWPRKPRMQFIGCEIYGPIANVYKTENEEEGTRFHDCRIEDRPHPDFPTWNGSSYLVNLGAGAANAEFKGCMVVSHSRKLIYIKSSMGRENFAQIIGCEFVLRDDAIPNRNAVAVIGGTYLSHVTFRDELLSPPPDGYYISIRNFGEVMVGEDVQALGPHSKWVHWGPRGFLGMLPPGLHNEK